MPSPTTAAPERRSRPSLVAQALRSPGPAEALPAQVAQPVRRSLGIDTSPVRVHRGAVATAAADSISARAFAYDNRVYLGSGQRPTDVGLMAHEVAHVVQQRGRPALQPFTTASSEPFEREAESVSAAVVAGQPARVTGHTAGPRIQRSILGAIGGAIVGGVKAIGEFAAEQLNAAKKAALDYVKEHARAFPGYDLLTFILERDPITNEPVARTPMGLAKGLLGLIPGGAAMYKDLEESGALQKTVDWFLAEAKSLDLSWAGIRALFATAWEQLSLGDLLPPTKAWDKIKAIFGPTVGRLVAFAKAAGKKILELMFEAVMGRGSLGEQILAFFRKVKAVFGIIVADPKKFLANLLASFKGGVQKFADNFVEHLKKALFEWLFGALKGALTIPKKLDLSGLIDIALQVLGLTYANVRMILVEKIGESAVGYIEKAFEFVKVLVTQGLPAAWEKLKEFATGVIDTIIEGIVSWVAKTIVGAAVIKLVSMFNPVGAFIQSIITIYDTVKFFIEKAKQIAAFINSVVDSIERIAMGNIAGAIDYVDRMLEKALGIVIAFLANFLHLGGIADKIRELIKKVQDRVLGGIRKLVDWVADKVKGLLAGRKDAPAGAGAAAGTAAAAAAGALPEKAFDADGEHHRIFLEQQGDIYVLMMASEKRRMKDFLKVVETEYPNVLTVPATKKALDDAKGFAASADAKAAQIRRTTNEKTLVGLRAELGALQLKLAQAFARVMAEVNIEDLDHGYLTEGMMASYGSMPKERADELTPDHQPQHALMKIVSGLPIFKTTRVADYSHTKGWAINLYAARHAEGQTFRRPVKADDVTKVNTAATKGRTDEERRANVLNIVRGIATSDGDKILAAVTVSKVEGTAPMWADVRRKLFGPKRKALRNQLATRIVNRIRQGEKKIAQQPFEY